MFEYFILGLIQGIAEWLPVSSEGMLILTQTHFFPHDTSLGHMVELALFLHLGTFFAALVYLHKDVYHLIITLFHFKSADDQSKRTVKFLIISTIISGVLGLGLLKLFETVELNEVTSIIITTFVALLLFITAGLQFTQKSSLQQRTGKSLTLTDSVMLGITQGFAALPGLSRSGLTVSALLLRNIDKTESLRLSFLMSLPIVLAGNILLNMDAFFLTPEAIVGLVSSFIFGLLTIDILLKVASKINFGYFVLTFAFLTLLSVFI